MNTEQRLKMIESKLDLILKALGQNTITIRNANEATPHHQDI